MRYKATKNGSVPFTVAEEAEAEVQEAKWEAGEPARLSAIKVKQENDYIKNTDSTLAKIKKDNLSELMDTINNSFSEYSTCSPEEIQKTIAQMTTMDEIKNVIVEIISDNVKLIQLTKAILKK